MNPRFLFVMSFLLIACAKQQAIIPVSQSATDAMVTVSSSFSSAMTHSLSIQKGIYASYHDGVIGDGLPALLFFHESSSALSQGTSDTIKSLYQSNSFPIMTYRIDYDSQEALKRRYTVVTQDTVVLVDGEGNAVTSMIHPSADELKELLTRFQKSL